jgi:drug/metabolite transporter (DMT)-like permease
VTAAAAMGAIATLVSTAFCLSTLERWRASRRPHEAAWTVSMAMFALASLSYFTAAAVGWGSLDFRTFYLFGAILNVPYLALGTVYLLGGRVFGDRVRFWLNLTAAFCAGVVLTAPISGSLDVPGIPSGKEVFGVGPRVMAAVGSGVGAVVLIGGAVWSAVSLLRLRRRPASGAPPAITPGRLALTNVLIAVGSIILGTGGTLFGTGDQLVDFGIWLAVGISVLFAGFLVSNPTRPVAHRPPTLSPYWTELYDLATAEPVGAEPVTAIS